MQFHLEYGRAGLDVDLPDDRPVYHLTYKEAPPLADPRGAVRAALAKPTGTAPLAELAAGRKTACILVCDITRPVPNELLLRPTLEVLESTGMPREGITILNATGLHRPNTRDELVEMLGAFIVDHYRIENHHGRELAEHTNLGTSPRGVPIWIDTRYVEAELKIATGLIEPHFMAGYSGGRKLICPGIAGVETIKVWHGPDFLEHPLADTGVLEGNPVHEENTWIARRAGCDFIVNVVIDEQRRPLCVVAGDMEAAFHQGVDFVRNIVTDTVPEPVDVVVTTCAGYPLDTTFYQSVKGMVAALPIVKEGGTIVIACSLSEGIGSDEFQGLFRASPTLDDAMQCILGKRHWTMDQWQVEELGKVYRKATVTMVSDGLPPDELKRLYVESAPTVEAAVADALQRHGPAAKLAVIPKGPYVVAQVA